jgi:hypothetical protein
MTHSTSRFAKTIAAVAVAAGTLLATPALAGATTTSTPANEVSDRAERACLRIPNLQTRTENLITRLNGGADVKGSLAWLEAQIAKAEANGKTELAETLRNRLAVRTASVDVLEQRLGELERLAERCAAAGVGA